MYRLKRRWLTVAVLIALVIVLLPVLFDQAKFFMSSTAQLGQLPEPMQAVSLQQSIAAAQAEIHQLADNPQPKLAKLSLSLDDSYVAAPQAFAVQVTSVTDLSQAIAIMTRLQKHGFAAYIMRVPKDKLMFYRVLVGPVITRTEAQKNADDMEKFMNYKMLIVSYQPK